MLRRSHKKSRRGCKECKRRHVKCDEARPACRLCTLSGRDCSFVSESTTESPSSDITPPPNAASPPPPERPDSSPLDEAINLHHMELVIHLTSDSEMFNLADPVHGDYSSNISRSLSLGLEAPYLLHQLLAFSARHLAALHHARSESYISQAVSLQTHAVSLFNKALAEKDVNQGNCVAIMLFSAVLGHHLLADTLCRRVPSSGGLGAFLEHYVQCIETNRGIYSVVRAAWPLLMQSELEPVLARSTEFTSRIPEGSHCRPMWELVDVTDGLTGAEKEACRLAVRYLQLGFDALGEEEVSYRYQMIFTWTMLAAPEFTALLAGKRPEALVILGFYALLLHHGRSMWQVRDAGAYIMGLIVDHLEPEWHHWLQYPRSMMVQDGV